MITVSILKLLLSGFLELLILSFTDFISASVQYLKLFPIFWSSSIWDSGSELGSPNFIHVPGW